MDFTLRVVDEGIEHLCKKRCCHFKTGGMTVPVFCSVQGIVNILLEDNLKQELTMAYRSSVQDEIVKLGSVLLSTLFWHIVPACRMK